MTTQAERALNAEVMLRLRAWPVIAFGIPNGIYMPARTEAERSLVARIINRMKADGQLTPGAPDLVCLWRGGGAAIELKRPRARDLFGVTQRAGRPSAPQMDLAERAAQLGIHHAFCDSWDSVRDRLIEWGAA